MKTTVEIYWDSPEDENWLNPSNIRQALRAYCTNTQFEVIGIKNESHAFTQALLDKAAASATFVPPNKPKVLDLINKIGRSINELSLENESDTPDYILVDFLGQVFDSLNVCIRRRELWYGRNSDEDRALTVACTDWPQVNT